mmetsp:Transcript_95312/g.269265  ORF Transcript_95312/g.269265 Transcript_95312/m.269265 type:complete len:379 (-) Transcript_95312:1305-2441(-)
MYRTPPSISTSKTTFGSRSSRSSSRSRAAHWLRTSGSDASFSRCSASSVLSWETLSFSISRTFFCRARTLRLTASLSPRSMTLGFGPFLLGSGGGCGGCSPPSAARRSLCSMRSASGCASGRSSWRSRQKRLASSRQLSPTLQSSSWVPQADWISKTSRSGCSRISISASSLASDARSSASASLSRSTSAPLILRRDCRALMRRLTVSLSRSSTSRMAAPARVPRRISGGGEGKSGATWLPVGSGRHWAAYISSNLRRYSAEPSVTLRNLSSAPKCASTAASSTRPSGEKSTVVIEGPITWSRSRRPATAAPARRATEPSGCASKRSMLSASLLMPAPRRLWTRRQKDRPCGSHRRQFRTPKRPRLILRGTPALPPRR